MMKKILSIFATICLLLIISSPVFAADCDETNCSTPNSCVNNVCTAPSATSRFQPSGPGVCIKVRSDFKMKLTDSNGTRVLSNISSGAIIASEPADPANCPYLVDESIIATAICQLSAGDTGGIKATDKCILPEPNEIGMVGMLNTIYTVTNWIFYILTLLAVLMIVYGGFLYISAAGDPEKATKGKTVLTLSIIGLAIALLAKFIPSLVRFILGV